MYVRVNVFSYMLCAMRQAVVDMSNHFHSSERLQQVSVVLVFPMFWAPCMSVVLLFPMYWAARMLFLLCFFQRCEARVSFY